MKELIKPDNYGVFGDMTFEARAYSTDIATAFGKNHKNVLRAIDAILSTESGFTPEFGRLNFEPISYTDKMNRKQRVYAISRDGFVALVMGFTGKEANHFKELYINKFNEMEQQLSALKESRDNFPKLTNSIRQVNPEAKAYHYSNECDMLNRLVLGCSAKQYRERNGLDKKEPIRPTLTEEQNKMLAYLEDIDSGLVLGVSDYHMRKQILELNLYKRFGTAALPERTTPI